MEPRPIVIIGLILALSILGITIHFCLQSNANSLSTDFRLPTQVKPKLYLVKLQPFMDGNGTFNGYVEITLNVLKPTDLIILHLKDIITKNETAKIQQVNSTAPSQYEVVRQVYDPERDFYTAYFNKQLIQDKEYIFSIQYTGILSSNLRGLYKASYNDKGIIRNYTASQGQPTHMRKIFPCYDEPNFKAQYDIKIVRKKNYTALAPMEKISTATVDSEGEWVEDTFARSCLMPSYLNAFVVADLVNINVTHVTEKNTATLFRVWARKSVIDQAEYALTKGQEMLSFLENYFEIVYPFKKLDSVALHSFGPGGMENWGLILYREQRLLYHPLYTSAESRKKILEIVAHELAHQWFGNLVTPLWWSDLWLSEGFATYMEHVVVNAAEPSFHAEEQFVEFIMLPVLVYDSFITSHPASQPVKHPDEIGDIFTIVTYYKGASLLRQLNFILTENNLKAGFTSYLNAFSYRNAKQDDLWNHLNLHAKNTMPPGGTVKNIMDSWTLKMGYPLITVIVFANGTALFKQERFLFQKPQNYVTDTSINYRWWVPLSYTNGSNPEFKNTAPHNWLSDTESQKLIDGMPPKHVWIIVNILLTGFYRVNYDQNNWNLLAIQLHTDHEVIPPINRMQILSDSFNLAEAGLLNFAIPLNIIKYLPKERSYTPLATSWKLLKYVLDKCIGKPCFTLLKTFSKTLFKPAYDAVGVHDDLTDPHLTQKSRTTLMSAMCFLDHQPCLSYALELYKEWMAQPNDLRIISPNLKSSVYCYGIKQGGEDEWNFAFARYIESVVPSDNVYLINALGCTKNTTLKTRYLHMTFNESSGISFQDVYKIIPAIANDPVGGELVFNYLKNNFETVNARFTTIRRVAYFIDAAVHFFNTEEELAKVKSLISTYPVLSGHGTRDVKKAVQDVQANIRFQEEDITNWLRNNVLE